MAEFSVNTERFDPYRNFKFRIKWDGEYVAGLSKCSPLKKTTEVADWREALRREGQGSRGPWHDARR